LKELFSFRPGESQIQEGGKSMPNWPWNRQKVEPPKVATPPRPSKSFGVLVAVLDGELKGVVQITSDTAATFDNTGLAELVQSSVGDLLATLTADEARKAAPGKVFDLYRRLQTALKDERGANAPSFQVVDFRIVD